jgi:hypothetical protein
VVIQSEPTPPVVVRRVRLQPDQSSRENGSSVGIAHDTLRDTASMTEEPMASRSFEETLDTSGPYVSYGFGAGYKGVVCYMTISKTGVKLLRP